MKRLCSFLGGPSLKNACNRLLLCRLRRNRPPLTFSHLLIANRPIVRYITSGVVVLPQSIGWMRLPTVSVYHYIDFRRYLGEVYAAQKQVDPRVTHRYVAQQLGLKSSGHVAQILSGKVNLSAQRVEKVLAFLKLSRREGEYFRAMVTFCQTKDPSVRNRCFETMMAFLGKKPRVLAASEYYFYSRWYHTAVLECIGLRGFDGDCRALGERIVPVLSTSQVRESVDVLKQLRLIEKDASGVYRKSSATLSSGYGTDPAPLATFHNEMIDRARESLLRPPLDERSLSTLSVGLSDAEYAMVVSEIRAFRRRVLAIASGPGAAQRVYQLNVHLFPLTCKVGGCA